MIRAYDLKARACGLTRHPVSSHGLTLEWCRDEVSPCRTFAIVYAFGHGELTQTEAAAAFERVLHDARAYAIEVLRCAPAHDVDLRAKGLVAQMLAEVG